MYKIRLVNRKIFQNWKVELITKATLINYRKRHSQFERENYCKQQNWLIESLNEGIFPKKRCRSWMKMSFDTHDDSFYVTKFHAIPLFGPMILLVFFFFFELLAWGLLTLSFFKKNLCCPFYIKVQLKIWSLKFSSCLILFLEILKSEHFSHFVMFSI